MLPVPVKHRRSCPCFSCVQEQRNLRYTIRQRLDAGETLRQVSGAVRLSLSRTNALDLLARQEAEGPEGGPLMVNDPETGIPVPAIRCRYCEDAIVRTQYQQHVTHGRCPQRKAKRGKPAPRSNADPKAVPEGAQQLPGFGAKELDPWLQGANNAAKRIRRRKRMYGAGAQQRLF